MTLPTIFPVDQTKEPHLRAPILDEELEDVVYQNYLINPSTHEHMIIVAAGANKRKPGQVSTVSII